MSPRPAIAITTPVTHAAFGVWDVPSAVLPEIYVGSVTRAGALALISAPDPVVTDDPDELLDRVDGVMISGGSDIDPASYGAVRHPETQSSQPDRDAFEVALARRAVARDIPVLGICRGMQVLNVAFGGTLHQHLPDLVGHSEHRRVPGSFDGSDHEVRLAEGSLAARAAGELTHNTKSHHHQGVDRVGEGLRVSGRSSLDELVEAIEIPGRRFVLGVQWHPEADVRSRIVAGLVAAAAVYRAELDSLSGGDVARLAVAPVR